MGNYNADSNPNLNKIRTVAFGFSFAAQSDLKVDQFSTTTSKKVYHLVRKIGSTNLSVLVEPDEISG